MLDTDTKRRIDTARDILIGNVPFLTADERQLVQFRPNGFSFNPLAPYGSLDDYFPEIEATWKSFLELAQPVEA